MCGVLTMSCVVFPQLHSLTQIIFHSLSSDILDGFLSPSSDDETKSALSSQWMDACLGYVLHQQQQSHSSLSFVENVTDITSQLPIMEHQQQALMEWDQKLSLILTYAVSEVRPYTHTHMAQKLSRDRGSGGPGDH